MSDGEWQRWQETFHRKEGVMPEVQKRVRRAQLGLVAGQGIFGLIALGELGYGISGVMYGPEPSDRLVAAFVIAFIAVTSALFVVITRGASRRVQQTPEALLAWTERMFRTSERAGTLARWGGLVACAGTTAAISWNHLHGRGGNLLLGAAVVLGTLASTWAMPVLIRRRLAKPRAQLDAWRKQLADG